MFALPSIWNLIISTIVFFIVAWYIHRYLEQHRIPKNTTRGILVLAVASFVSWSAGAMVDWTQEKIEGPQLAVQTSGDLSQLLKAVGQTHP